MSRDKMIIRSDEMNMYYTWDEVLGLILFSCVLTFAVVFFIHKV